ncbi:MAG: hypothetical protein PSN36_05280 [Gammaproteobacteria bacterium]|nr:hypothetical protein [Gammaproteobacteria bacterium]
MLSQRPGITYINIIFSMIIVALSVYTISWHNQNYQLYKVANAVQKKNQKIMALHKQLLSEHSAQISGKMIKEKALKILQMKHPNRIRTLVL